MNLFLHNLLCCRKMNCPKRFPLNISVSESHLDERELTEKDLLMIKKTIPTLDWSVFRANAASLGISQLPEEIFTEDLENNDLLVEIFRALMLAEIDSGSLVCDGCGQQYSITHGIPDMVLGAQQQE